MEKSRKCDIFEKDFHRSSNAKLLRKKSIWKMKNKIN